MITTTHKKAHLVIHEELSSVGSGDEPGDAFESEEDDADVVDVLHEVVVGMHGGHGRQTVPRY